VQTKLHEENAALGKTQEHFQRAQREGDFDTEKYEATCTAAMFRIQVCCIVLSCYYIMILFTITVQV
jgi:hypothetical protein